MLFVGLAALACADDGSGSNGGTDGDSDSDTDSDADTDTPVCENGVWEGDHNIYTDEDIDTLSGYVEITGDLAVVLSEVEDLTGLECLITVGGELVILNNDWITSVDGLNNLETIEDTLTIADNGGITNLDGLGSLTAINGMGDFWIWNNQNLPYCEICELMDQLVTGPGILDVSDNLEDSCYPFPANCP
jgi:hypothetical protein